MNIKGAIFDFDGTLFDSMFIWNNIAEEYLKTKNIKAKVGLRTAVRSLSLFQASSFIREDYCLSDSVKQIMCDVNSMIENFYQNQGVLKKGAKEYLSHLSANNVKMCIATATDEYLVNAALKRTGIFDFFEKIFTNEQIGKGKDCPDIYFKALDFLGTEKSSTIVFEDALYAAKTAKFAGFNVVGISDDSSKDQKNELKNIVDMFINDWSEIYEEDFDNCRI